MNRKNCSDGILQEMLDRADEYTGNNLMTLDIFCGDGHMISKHLFERSNQYTGIEIDLDKVDKLEHKFPHMSFICADSIEWLKTSRIQTGFNFVFIDNPLGGYGYKDKYCEHFELLEYMARLPSEKIALVLDVVPRPYSANEKKNECWMQRRETFYKINDATDICTDYLHEFYESYLRKIGFNVTYQSNECREWDDDVDYFHFFYFELEK